jgi:FixJ family two-component response regulator
METGMAELQNGKVFVVDDDRKILTALSRLLGAEGFDVATYQSPVKFLSEHDPSVPGCAVLDVGMDDLDGLCVQQALDSEGGRPVIFLTGCDDVRTGVQAMKSGALDYLTKPVKDVDLFAAVRRALDYDSRTRRRREIIENYTALRATLTPREREVLQHVIAGRLNKQIAHALGTVEKTVKVHRAHIMQKMRVRSVAALVHIVEALSGAENADS